MKPRLVRGVGGLDLRNYLRPGPRHGSSGDRSFVLSADTQKTPTQPASYASTDSSHYKYIKRLTIISVPGNKVELDWSRRNPFNASSLSISNFPAATLQSGRGERPVEVSTKFCGTFHNIILRRHPPPARQRLTSPHRKHLQESMKALF